VWPNVLEVRHERDQPGPPGRSLPALLGLVVALPRWPPLSNLDSHEHIPARLDYYEQHLPGCKRDAGGIWVSARCLLSNHKNGDENPSLRFNAKTGAGKCHGGGCGWTGTITEYAKLCNLPTEGLPGVPPKKSTQKAPSQHFIYTDRDGNRLLRVTRSQDKRFYQNTWDGKRWVKGGLKEAPLFNAPALAAAKAGSLVFVVEGEKCAQHLVDRGQLATTAPEGAGKFSKVGRDWLDLLLPLGVAILPDNDRPGYSHALQVAERLQKELAIDSKVLLLPGLGPKEDVADWLTLPRRPADLLDLVASALSLEAFRAHAATTFPGEDLTVLENSRSEPEASALHVQLDGLTVDRAELALKGMRGANQPLRVFISKTLDKICSFRDGVVTPCLHPDQMAHLQEGILGLRFFEKDRHGEYRPVDAPDKVNKRILAMPSHDTGFPEIRDFMDVPVMTKAGSLLCSPGRHGDVYYQPSLDIPEVPSNPSPELVAECRRRIDFMVGDISFQSHWDLQAFYALLLGYVLRLYIQGCVPLCLVSAAVQGAGKGLTVSIPSWIFTGRNPPVISLDSSAKNEDVKKTLLSLLLSRPGPLINFDNFKGHFGLPCIEAYLTSPEYTDRVLGGSVIATVRSDIQFALTANNATFSRDMERRLYEIRLDPDTEQPWLRTFRIPDLKSYVLDNRPQLLWSALVLVQYWIAAGRPEGTYRIGSFESWSANIGGLLDCIGVGSDFLTRTRSDSSDQFDPWQIFAQLWLDSSLPRKNQRASDLCRFIDDSGLTVSENSRAHSLGKRMARNIDRVFRLDYRGSRERFRLVNHPAGSNSTWSLLEVEGERLNNNPPRFTHLEGVLNPLNPKIPPEPFADSVSPAGSAAGIDQPSPEIPDADPAQLKGVPV
jgi:hypothetical protein